MSKVDQKIIARFDELIAKGENPSIYRPQFMPFGFQPNDGSYIAVESSFAYGWRADVVDLLFRVMGKESSYYHHLESMINQGFDFSLPSNIKSATGILKSAKEAYKNGYLFDLRKLVEAEIFDDLLEQAEQLLKDGYFIPAAVLAGCVLEDGLRKLCDKEGITLPDQPKLNWMNDELAKKNVYNALTKKNVTTLSALRNDAAHGKWVGLTGRDAQQMKDEVGRMIPAVRSFLEYQLT